MPVSASLDITMRTIMTVVSMRPVLRLLLVVLMLLLTGPLRACEPLAAKSSEVGRRPPGFTEVYPYTDGIEVQVTDVWTGRRFGVPVVELTVTIRNGSAHSFETWIRGELLYGPYRMPAVRYVTPLIASGADPDQEPRPAVQPAPGETWPARGPDDSGSVQLLAMGEYSDPYRLSFVVPSGGLDDVMFNLAIDAGMHDPAVFVGEL